MLIVNHLFSSYSKKGKTVLEDVSFQLGDGEIGVLLGPNGAGKSTLFQSILGTLKTKNGEILIDGVSQEDSKRKEWAQKIAYVPQRIPSSSLSVFETVLLGRMPYFSLTPGKEDKESTIQILEELGLSSFQNKATNELSGGELQKVAIACALNQNPSLLLLDEPTSNLDIKNSVLLQGLCKKLAKTHRISILIATHDLNSALDLGNRFYFLKEGKLIGQGKEDAFNEENVFNTFGVHVGISIAGGDKHIHFHLEEEHHHE